MSILSICKESYQESPREATHAALTGFLLLAWYNFNHEKVKIVSTPLWKLLLELCLLFLFSFMLPYFFLFSLDFCIRDTASSLTFVLRYGFLGPTLRTVSPAQYKRKAFSQKITNDVMFTLFWSGLW